jgi:assimilatory nitrate reductase catalytic subunit
VSALAGIQVGVDVGAGVDTHCPYCALQCATTLTAITTPAAAGGAAGRTEVRVVGRDFPTNRGGLCQKGWTAPQVLTVPDRLTTPLLRGRLLADPSAPHPTAPDPTQLYPTSWDVALDVVAEQLRRIQGDHGKDAVAVFGGGGLTNEKAYALGKFARVVLGTAQIDYNGRFCMSSAAAAANRAFGLDRGLPFPLADVGGADAVLLAGSNLAETMPPAMVHLSRAIQNRGLLVIDPRRTPTAAAATEGGGLHLQNTPGTDLALLLSLLHVVVHEGLRDEAYIAARTVGFDTVLRAVGPWWPERAEGVTGVPAPVIREAAHRLAAASPAGGGQGAYLLTGRGAEQHTTGTDTVTACIDLALALGLPGRVGSGYGALTGQGNGQGGREHGQKADQLPGYRRIDDPQARAHVAAVWGVDPAQLPGPGRSAVELIEAIGCPDGPRALLVHGSNLAVSAPNSNRVRQRLGALDLLVVCDVVPSETALLADVVLPVTQWAEEEGTLTTLEGRVVRRRQAVSPPVGVRSDLEVLAGLSARLREAPSTSDPGVTIATDPQVVFAELARASAGGPADYSGLSYDRLDTGEALFWPCPSPSHPGTPRLFLDAFATADGRARFVAVEHRPPHDDLRAEAPLYLITGRVLPHYQSGAQTRRVAELAAVAPAPFVELHPALAARLGIEDGDQVQVTSSRGSAVAPARISGSARHDTVFMPFHWAGAGSANNVTDDALDPISRMPAFKVCAVSVSRWVAPDKPHATAGVAETAGLAATAGAGVA